MYCKTSNPVCFQSCAASGTYMLPPIHMYITAPSESLPIYGWNWQNCTRILWKYDQNLAEATILNCHLANKHVSVFSLNIVMFLQPNGFGLVLWIWLCFWTTNMTKIVSSISLYSAVYVFSCPGSSVPTLVTATFEIRVISGQKTKRQKY